VDNFTNTGFSTRHNADFPGTAALDDGSLSNEGRASSPEVMQMDATMGYLTAVTELLVQNRHQGIYVLPNLPRHCRELEFDGIRAEGAFLIGATVEDGKTIDVRVKSEKGGKLRIAPGIEGRYSYRDGETGEALLEIQMVAGEALTLRAV
jgi:hypothetical protein